MLAVATLAAVLLVAPTAPSAPGDIADLSVTKSDSPDPVTAGTILSYTVIVTNNGPQEATGVVLSDRLPRQSELISATALAGGCERKGTTVACDLGRLNKGATASATIKVRPTGAGTIENTAAVDSLETDPIAANDRVTVSTEVLSPSTCRGVPATIVGTAGSDRLLGTPGPDVIAGLAGRDTIGGFTGRDLICAGGGADLVRAGPAADRVFGGRGRDTLMGNGGPDLVAGNPGRDHIIGNPGRDRLRGGTGFDRCSGGPGFDRSRGCER